MRILELVLVVPIIYEINCFPFHLRRGIRLQQKWKYATMMSSFEDDDPILAIDIGSTCVKCAAYHGNWPLRPFSGSKLQIHTNFAYF